MNSFVIKISNTEEQIVETMFVKIFREGQPNDELIIRKREDLTDEQKQVYDDFIALAFELEQE